MKRGGPLRRRTPLRASRGLSGGSSGKLRQRSARKAAQDEAWYHVRFAVLARDGYRCRRCAVADHVALLHVHHRLMRSQGGGDDPANLLSLCNGCHAYVHAHPAESYAAGWLIRRG